MEEIKIKNALKSRLSSIIDFVLLSIPVFLITIVLAFALTDVLNGTLSLSNKELVGIMVYLVLLIFEIHYAWLMVTARDFILGNDYLRLPSPRFINEEYKLTRFLEPIIPFANIEKIKILQNGNNDWVEIMGYNRSKKVNGLKIVIKGDKEYLIIDEKYYPLKKTVDAILNYQVEHK